MTLTKISRWQKLKKKIRSNTQKEIRKKLRKIWGLLVSLAGSKHKEKWNWDWQWWSFHTLKQDRQRKRQNGVQASAVEPKHTEQWEDRKRDGKTTLINSSSQRKQKRQEETTSKTMTRGSEQQKTKKYGKRLCQKNRKPNSHHDDSKCSHFSRDQKQCSNDVWAGTNKASKRRLLGGRQEDEEGQSLQERYLDWQEQRQFLTPMQWATVRWRRWSLTGLKSSSHRCAESATLFPGHSLRNPRIPQSGWEFANVKQHRLFSVFFWYRPLSFTVCWSPSCQTSKNWTA